MNKLQNSMSHVQHYLSRTIFFSRWLQAPLYLGLVVILVLYLYEYFRGLWSLTKSINTMSEVTMMINVLNLIDVVLIANLLIMIIMSGYQNFVSNLKIENHPDKPSWFDNLDASSMKVKVAIALVAISSIHLLRIFFDPSRTSDSIIKWQVIIHLTFLLSAFTLAFIHKLTYPK